MIAKFVVELNVVQTVRLLRPHHSEPQRSLILDQLSVLHSGGTHLIQNKAKTKVIEQTRLQQSLSRRSQPSRLCVRSFPWTTRPFRQERGHRPEGGFLLKRAICGALARAFPPEAGRSWPLLRSSHFLVPFSCNGEI